MGSKQTTFEKPNLTGKIVIITGATTGIRPHVLKKS
jgi:hypothetical protein